tara:strand:+ start:862 stop:1275 length:414 start_codon:yes stop_codon:yes gene_type:complete
MATFAELNDNNVVLRTLSVHNNELLDDGNESEDKGIAFLKSLFGSNTNWKQTSYNTKYGVYYQVNSSTPHSDQSKVFRRTKAAVGGVYDPDRNAFADPQIYDSWTLDQNTGKWEPPTARPDETGYFWNESQQKWLRN